MLGRSHTSRSHRMMGLTCDVANMDGFFSGGREGGSRPLCVAVGEHLVHG